VPAAARLRGPIDAEILGAALTEVVRRHESLRASFHFVEGVPCQRIAAEVLPEVQRSSLRALPEGERLGRSIELARELAGRPFDVAVGPLVRVALFELDQDDHFLVFVAHHLAVDGWSMQQLFAEWSAIYLALAAGEACPLPPPRFHFPDYAHWQRQYLQGSVLDELRSWWRAQLSGLNPLQLAGDRARPAVRSTRGGCCSFEIPPATFEALRALGRDTGTTSYMVCLAAYALLLLRQGGPEDLAVASPVADRPLGELHDVLGSFINTVVLRVDLSGNPTVRTLLERVRRMTGDTFAHGRLPFEQVVADLEQGRDLGQDPLAQTMLIVHHGRPAQLDLPGMAVEAHELHLDVAMFDLTLTVREGDRVDAWFEYSSDLFDPATIEQMRDRWLTLLAELPRVLDRPIREVPVLPPAETEALLERFNATARSYDLATSVRQRIVEQAARTPDARAVSFEDRHLTYAQLLRWARALAQQLASRGVGANALVPVVLSRSLDLVPGLLAVLEAGAAFVPVDANWPEERLRQAVQRLRPAAVLVDAASAGLPGLDGLPLVAAAEPAAVGDVPQASAPWPEPEAPVYGYYTSGSTGEPKLALVAHRGLVNRFSWMDEFFGTRPVTLQTTNQVFDSAVWQLLWPLCSGGHAVVPSDSPVITAEEVERLIEQHGITIVDFVPSVLDALLPQLAADPRLRERLSTLRDVILGGEALRSQTLRTFRQAMPGVRMINLYGPTEATIGCVAAVLEGDEDVVPIGRPIANVRTVVLDDHGQLAPRGTPGELYLAGSCLGLGYFENEVATRAAFVPNPFPALDSGLLYRTGDRVRLRPDGVIDFLGRCDDQIKIRGFRIEPGEIEAAIRAYPGVREAFVALNPTGEAGRELWAWVAPEVAPEDLLEHLQRQLPSALVPVRVVTCRALPRLAGGKVNRRALPAPSLGPASTAAQDPPKTLLERTVAETWQKVLRLDSVSRSASFFDVGGNSLATIAVQVELERRLGRSIPLVTLFRYPTVARLASHLAGTAARELAVIVPDPVRQQTLARRNQRG
jgi:amino acid adenylation domain-containing protein